jgi:hypothetical protein
VHGPELVPEIDHRRLGRERRLRRDSLGERGGEYERLERGPRLALALDREVELALVEVPSADHCEDAPVPRIHRHERRRRPVLVGQPLSNRVLGESLQLEVDGRIDLQAVAEYGPRPVVGHELLLDVLGEVRLVALPGRQVDVLRLRQRDPVRLDGVGPRDEALLDHEVEDGGAAEAGAGGVLDRIERARACRQPGEERRLGKRQLRRMRVEIDACGHLDAVGAVPEVDRVQVRGQDPVFRPAALELPSERGLLELAADRALALRVRVLDELLGDRRSALHQLLVADVCPDRAHDPLEVDPAMLPEPSVLDRHDGLLHHGRDLIGVDDDPTLVPVEHGEHRLPVGGVDVAELLDVVLFGRLERGDVARHGTHEPEHERDERDDQEK